MGASHLQKAAHALEARLDSLCAVQKAGIVGAFATTELETFAVALAQVLNAVTSLEAPLTEMSIMSIVEANMCEQCDWQQAGKLFGQVRELVDNFDFVPDELITALQTSIPCTCLSKQINMLRQSIENTDYDRARSLLEEIGLTQKLATTQ